jgi:response regulator of citrate/malate metabolism
MTATSPLLIAVVDDSPFYTRYLAKQLEAYEPLLSPQGRPAITLRTYLTADEFMSSVDASTDIAFIDFYLDNGKTALDLIPDLKKAAPNCEVVIISQAQKAKSELRKQVDGSVRFILKGSEAAMQGRLMLHDLISSHLLSRQAEVE